MKLEYNKSFGEYVKSLRKKRGYTQVDLAEKIENNFQNISSLERDKFGPSLNYLYKLAKAFDMSIVQFIQGFEDFNSNQ